MAELEAAIETRLLAYGNLTALVVDRIFPLILHVDDTTHKVIYPAVTYQRTDGPRESALDSDMGLAHPTIEISSWGETYESAKAVATQVRSALQRWDDADATPAVLDCLLERDEDIYESEAGVFRIQQDWTVWHRE